MKLKVTHMNKVIFKKSIVATAISVSLGAGFAGNTYANDAADNVEVIEVKGIKGSLIKSMDIKRESNGVVDSITAEDIGKFPDTNLAESLQRITGVSIDRANGEGSRVTVRGFGPEFNLVTLNGRQMPASSLEATAASSSRSFDFANLASEGVAGVEVYKTGRADVATGGMGSTINILTTKPLNAPGLKATIGVKGVMDQSKESGSSMTPEISGLYSNTSDDERFGISLSGSYQKRQSGNNQAFTGGWRTFPGNINGYDWGGGNADWGGLIPASEGAHQNGPVSADTIYSVPQSMGYKFSDVERVRTNGQLTLQFRPVDTLTATLDYTYSKNEVQEQFSDVSAWFNFGPSAGQWTDGPIQAPLVYSEFHDAPADLAMGRGEFTTTNQNRLLGLNLEWQATDNLKLELDTHAATAESSPNGPFGSNNVIATAAFVRGVSTGRFDTEMPVMQITMPEGEVLEPEDILIAGSSFRNSMMKSEIDQFQLKGEYVFDSGMIDSIDFGVSTLEVKNRSAFSNVQQDNWGGLGAAGDLDDSLFTKDTIAPYFSANGSDSSYLLPYFYRHDFNGMVNIASERHGVVGGVGDCGTSFCASSDYTTDRRTTEEQQAAYVQANISTDLMDKPVNLVVGLRYETTDVESSALVPTYSNISWAGANEFNLVSTGQSDFTNLTGSYSNVLPNIDFNIEVVEDLLLRASYSKTIARPSYADIQGGLTIDPLLRVNGGTGNRGNPELKPFESTNIDLSLEYYYDEGSYLAVGYYKKDAENFIGRATVTETVFDLPHPAQGTRYAAAQAAGETTADGIRQFIIDNYPDTLDANGNPLGVAGDDSFAEFNVTIPVNQRENTIDGWEFASQHLFGDSGFGSILNYTMVDGDITFDNFSLEPQTALLGLSDSANAVLFYEKDGFQARIAYNWRDQFLASTVNGQGLNNPLYVEAYGQWDANVSYEFNEHFVVFAEAINITDEYYRLIERRSEQLVNLTETGPRYNLGLRYKF